MNVLQPVRSSSAADTTALVSPRAVAVLSVCALGVGWLLVGKAPWLLLAAQLWLGYALSWWGLQVIARWTGLRSGPALMGWTVGVAAGVGLLVIPVSADFLPDRLASWHWVTARSLPPALFALAFLLPGMVMTWREQQRRDRQLALAEQQRAVAELSRHLTLAELKSLQAQVEPHFLYNTLAGVQYLVRRNPPLADQMLEHLIAYLRRALPAMRSRASTVQAECELVRAYLEIMKLRLGERLRFHVDCSADAAALPLPPMMLATLVENAIKHGIEPLPQGGRIDVHARREGADLCVTVTDTGAGLGGTGNGAGAAGGGTGLANTADRLRALYGDAASLSVQSRPGGGVVAGLRVALASLSPASEKEAV